VNAAPEAHVGGGHDREPSYSRRGYFQEFHRLPIPVLVHPLEEVRMFRTALALATATSALLGASCLEAQSTVHRTAHHDYRLVSVAEGLVNPWGLAFLPNGDLLITERPGRLRLIREGRLLPDPVPGLPAIRTGGQGGLLDIALHPDFATNRYVYLSYSKPGATDSTGTTAVARARWENDRLEGLEEIFAAQLWSAGRGHHGSRLAFHPDGHLFVAFGDRQVPPTGDLEKHPAQLLSDHFGTIVRLRDDGSVPSDNPFVGQAGALPEIWSYGHRNIQGMVIDQATGDIWASEHGPQGGDEVNRVLPGRNYGWPVIGFGVNYRNGTAIHAATQREGMEQPAHLWVPSIGVSGMMLYTGDAVPLWKGSLFNGGLVGEVLSRVTLGAERSLSEERMVERMGRIRDVRQGPDGFIYIAFEHRGGEPTAVMRMEPVARD